MILSQLIQMCSHHHSPVLEHSHVSKEFFCALCSEFLFPSPVLGDDLLSFPVTLAFLDILYTNGVRQIEYLYLASVTKIHSCCVHFQFIIFFFFVNHVMLIPLPTDGYLGCFQFGAIMIDASMIICFHFSWLDTQE